MRAALAIVVLIVGYVIIKEEVLDGQLTLLAIGVLVLIALPLFAVGKQGKIKDETVNQQQRDAAIQARVDADAKRALAAPAGGAAAPPPEQTVESRPAIADRELPKTDILFLRPFLIDNALRVRNPRLDSLAAWFVPFYKFILPDTVSLDDAIRLHLQSHGQLVAIGAMGSVVGASRVRVGDSHWRHYFDVLASNAKIIVAFCALRPGTVWELEQVVQDPALLRKTVFLLPPDQLEGTADALDLGQIVAKLQALGLQLPTDLKSGEALVFDQGGSVRSRVAAISRPFIAYNLSKKALRTCVAEIAVRPAAVNSSSR